MKKHFHPDVQYTIPTGGMFIWVTLPESVDMLTFVKKALEKNVAVVPGNAFLDDDTKECHSFRKSEGKVNMSLYLGECSYHFLKEKNSLINKKDFVQNDIEALIEESERRCGKNTGTQ